ncbi:polyprenyl synthetase family protein [Streptomyces sp. 4N509B]|uniref:polyprenyl synthetase family protein n=1 Tax=Streptomyces sp. 4N509B TaxID=3457413 RepID=UPI003FD5A71A
MRSPQTIPRLTAEQPHRPPAGPVPPARPDHDANDARLVDDDVSGAVDREIGTVLAERLAACRELDAVFARDIAERVDRFTRRGGRRIRPRLVWWSLRACGGADTTQVRAGLRVAAALELIQTCALVHDDLMDQAPTRRGRPALHAAVARQYDAAAPAHATPGAPVTAGSGTGSDRPAAPPPAARRLGASAAVLAGDLALAWADDVLTDLALDAGLPPGTTRRLAEVWRALRTEMVAGQYLDVREQAVAAPTPARALRAACLKSALYTVERPLLLGAVLAGADAATTRALRRAGRCAGLAFQLRDDLDDVFADPRVTGKPSGGDVREGKPTYLMATARALASAAGDTAALGVLDRANGRADLPDGALDEVRDVLVATGARALVEKKIVRLAGRCRHRLHEAALEPRARARLGSLLAEATGTPDRAPEPGVGPRAAAPTLAGTEARR